MGAASARFGRLLVLAAGVAVVVVLAVILLVPEQARPHRSARARSPRTAGRRPSAHAGAARRPRRWRQLIGRSVQGRPIAVVEVGWPRAVRRVLVVGCIHGSEPAGIAIARRLEASTPPRGADVWIVPDVNPDGVAAGTRQNAHGVDLNRNFPWHWRVLGTLGGWEYSGPRPLSEPEARAVDRLIVRVRPQITIWFHQHQTLVDLSGGNTGIERSFARLVGLPVRRLTRYPGSVVSWENALLGGSTAFVVELPSGQLTSAATKRYAQAVLRLANPAVSP